MTPEQWFANPPQATTLHKIVATVAVMAVVSLSLSLAVSLIVFTVWGVVG